jgi:hypothetical protein
VQYLGADGRTASQDAIVKASCKISPIKPSCITQLCAPCCSAESIDSQGQDCWGVFGMRLAHGSRQATWNSYSFDATNTTVMTAHRFLNRFPHAAIVWRRLDGLAELNKHSDAGVHPPRSQGLAPRQTHSLRMVCCQAGNGCCRIRVVVIPLVVKAVTGNGAATTKATQHQKKQLRNNRVM